MQISFKKTIALFMWLSIGISISSYSQPQYTSLTFEDLRFIHNNDNEQVDDMLGKKGYVYQESYDNGVGCKDLVWSKNHHEGLAESFITKSCDKVAYSFPNRDLFDKYKQIVKSAGFSFFSTGESDGDLSITYLKGTNRVIFRSGKTSGIATYAVLITAESLGSDSPGDTDLIRKIKNRIRNQSPDAELFASLGIAYDNIGQNSTAIKCYKKALSIDEMNYTSNYNLGVTYYNSAMEYVKNGDEIKACKVIKEARLPIINAVSLKPFEGDLNEQIENVKKMIDFCTKNGY